MRNNEQFNHGATTDNMGERFRSAHPAKPETIKPMILNTAELTYGTTNKDLEARLEHYADVLFACDPDGRLEDLVRDLREAAEWAGAGDQVGKLEAKVENLEEELVSPAADDERAAYSDKIDAYAELQNFDHARDVLHTILRWREAQDLALANAKAAGDQELADMLEGLLAQFPQTADEINEAYNDVITADDANIYTVLEAAIPERFELT